MFQEIITYLILTATAIALLLNVRNFFRNSAKSGESGKCAGCAGGCEIKQFRDFYQPKILKPEHYKLKL